MKSTENRASDSSKQIRALTSGQRLRMRKAGSCKDEILETRESRVDFLETRSELFKKQVRWPHYFVLKLGSVDLKKTTGEILKNSLDRIYSHSKITVFSNYIKSAPENFFKLSIVVPIFM